MQSYKKYQREISAINLNYYASIGLFYNCAIWQLLDDGESRAGIQVLLADVGIQR